MKKIFIGIDVSKKTLDASVIIPSQCDDQPLIKAYGANNENSFSLFGIEKVVDFKMIEENGQFIGVRVLHSIPSKVWKTRNGNSIGGERVLKMSTVWFVENHSDLCHDDFNARQAQITKIYKKAIKKSASEENKKTVKVCCVLHKANGETKKIAKVFKKVA